MLKAFSTSLAAAACMVAAADAAVFVENFDNGAPVQSWDVFDGYGQFVVTDGAGIEIQRSGVATDPHSGGADGQYVELDSHGANSNSSIAAIVDLVSGMTYEMTFAYMPRTSNVDDNGIGFSVGTLVGTQFTTSQSVGSVNKTAAEQSGWDIVSFVFTALDGDNAIQFAALGAANTLGGLIDTVKVEEVATPVPAAGLLLITGIAALRTVRQKKRLTLG